MEDGPDYFPPPSPKGPYFDRSRLPKTHPGTPLSRHYNTETKSEKAQEQLAAMEAARKTEPFCVRLLVETRAWALTKPPGFWRAVFEQMEAVEQEEIQRLTRGY